MRIIRSPSFWRAVVRIGTLIGCAGLTLATSGIAAEHPEHPRFFLLAVCLGLSTAVGLLYEMRRKW
jgi:hypothetical protein